MPSSLSRADGSPGAASATSFVDYRIMTAVDVPRRIITDYAEVPQDDGPWGARGVGERPMIATAPAIANASTTHWASASATCR